MKMFARKLLVLCLVVLLTGFLATACGGGSSSSASQGNLVKSDKGRDMTPETGQPDLDELVEGNTTFAFDMYRAIRQGDDNLIYSPYSISLALAMTYAGAKNRTEQQMMNALSFTLDQDKLHPAFNALDLELTSRGEGAEGTDEKGFRLNIANSIWGQEDYSFLSGFLDTLAENYGAGLRLLNFATAPEESRVIINDWVSDETEGKIEDLLPQGSISSLTRLVLTNAIYFNAAWDFPFNESATRPGAFHLLDGGEVTVNMMSQVKHFRYAEGRDYQVVELPYDGQELSMVLFIPKSGCFNAFESSLTENKVDNILAGLSSTNVSLTMPKFTFEFSLGLNEILARMGMFDAFNPTAADFSGMDGSRDLFISDVFHKAFIAVDEAGTEAAAATAVVVGLTAMPAPPVEVTADRPFIFIIRDLETKTILFMGRVLNPETQT